ncbi:MAG: glycerophosphodiester phosphodiesterase family protein [Bacteroidota bacterium]
MRLSLIFVVHFFYQLAFTQVNKVEIYGHRGFRGLYPENSIIGFQKAIELGINGIELDVVLNKNKELVISHEHFFQKEFCLDSLGKEIQKESDYTIYNLTQEQISRFDCGSKYHSKFPDQIKLKTTKPLFQDFITSTNLHNVILLFEVKSNPKEYGISQPEPKEYCEIILNELKKYPFKSNVRIMSFDNQILEELHKLDSSYPLIYLTYLPKSPRYFLKKLSFTPYALGMFYPTINKRKVNELNELKIKLFAWTVNSKDTAGKLIHYGVDGIISDFPNLMMEAQK